MSEMHKVTDCDSHSTCHVSFGFAGRKKKKKMMMMMMMVMSSASIFVRWFVSSLWVTLISLTDCICSLLSCWFWFCQKNDDNDDEEFS